MFAMGAFERVTPDFFKVWLLGSDFLKHVRRERWISQNRRILGA